MNLLIIGLKILLIASWCLTALGVVKLYQEDSGVHMKFDWLSMMNISGTIGLTLVSLIAVIDASTYAFTLSLLIITVAMVWFLKIRLMITGDHKVLLGNHMIEHSSIKKVYSRFMTLYIDTKDQKTIKLYAPVTDRSVTMLLYEKAEGKRK